MRIHSGIIAFVSDLILKLFFVLMYTHYLSKFWKSLSCRMGRTQKQPGRKVATPDLRSAGSV